MKIWLSKWHFFISVFALSIHSFASASLHWTHNTTDQLIRTVQIGSLQDIELQEIYDIALDDRSQYHEHILARAALLVLGKEGEFFKAWPMERLLDRSLQQLSRGQLSYIKPNGFRAEHLIYTLVYAMVTADQEQAAVTVLEQHLSTRVKFKRAVVLQALRNIGSRDAADIIQQVASEDNFQSQLANNLLADYHYPFLHQLAQRLPQIDIQQRDQNQLIQIASNDACSIPASLAVYLLGFFPSDESASSLNHTAKQLLRELNHVDCFYTRFFARRSLAMRSTESPEFWIEQFVSENDAWQRAQLVRILFIHHGHSFQNQALDLLSSEEAQYVQWELMHGYFEWKKDSSWLSWWDLWLPSTLQMRLDLSKKDAISTSKINHLLDWLEAGNSASDEWVHNHLMYRIAGVAKGAQLQRFLNYFASLLDESDRFWVLQPINDKVALDQLKFWLNDYPKSQSLQQLINKIEH